MDKKREIKKEPVDWSSTIVEELNCPIYATNNEIYSKIKEENEPLYVDINLKTEDEKWENETNASDDGCESNPSSSVKEDDGGSPSLQCNALLPIKEFILKFEVLSELWDTTNPQYTNKYKRNENLTKLLPILRQIKPNATLEDVKKKINTIRSNYRRELNKIQSSIRSGASVDEVYTPKIWYFPYLNFLSKLEQSTPSNQETETTQQVQSSPETNHKSHESSQQTRDIAEERIFSSISTAGKPSVSSTTKKKKINHDALLDLACQYLSTPCTQVNVPNPIALEWSNTLDRLDPVQRLYAKKAINDILFEAELGNLEYCFGMNARSQTFELAVEGRQVDEAVASIFHTVLFHRSMGKFRYKQEGSYSVGTIGYEDVDCDFIDFTYVRCSSESLDRTLKREISSFPKALRENDGLSSGQISLDFFQKKKNMFRATECIPWELWSVRLELIKISNEHERQLHRERLGDMLTDKIMYIAEVMNKHDYVPKMPNQSELDLIFDTTYPDLQPYLFKLSFATSGLAVSSMGSTMKKIIRETLSL